MVRCLNIDGDGQEGLAGHGGEQRAVLVYQIESYRFGRRFWAGTIWSRTILVRTSRSTACPTTVCVGDGYRIGDAVFEVTQPRVTCYRVGIRLGEPRMAPWLGSHRRSGFYCRVLQEGLVEAG